MSVAIKIEISDEPTGYTVHRFRNFGEEIYQELGALVSLAEIDRSTTSFMVRDINEHDLGAVTRTIQRVLRKHYFDQTATLTTV